ETELERMILSSPAARYFIAALATFTAPLVEEVVFRGVLYSGLRRGFIWLLGITRHVRNNFAEVKQAWRDETLYGVISYLFDLKKVLKNKYEGDGKASTILGAIVVILIFAAIHVPQYWPNVAAISTILLLSSVLTVVRARTGRLLPCFVIHVIFNGITSVVIVLYPFLQHATPPTIPPTTTPTGALLFLSARAAQLFF
ncbi:MAG: CPBP family intramembrane glutamic endopeptidase, partial [Pyrinomonadaceae bacterium]